jgi:serine/threonine protein kinase
MPPELLTILENGSNDYEILRKIDVWSAGCILLEILTGMPLWFRYKCRVEVKGRPTVQLGLFALTGREYRKIIKKQRELCDNMGKVAITHKEL